MIKKVQILFLLFLFFGSTTSLPITMHLCNMMKNSDMKTCKMDMSKNMKEKHCPLKSNADRETKSSFQNPPCCVPTIKDFKLKDEFVQSSNKTVTELTLEKISTSNLIDFNSNKAISYSNLNINSPPHRIDNHIYLSFSLLLI